MMGNQRGLAEKLPVWQPSGYNRGCGRVGVGVGVGGLVSQHIVHPDSRPEHLFREERSDSVCVWLLFLSTVVWISSKSNRRDSKERKESKDSHSGGFTGALSVVRFEGALLVRWLNYCRSTTHNSPKTKQEDENGRSVLGRAEEF